MGGPFPHRWAVMFLVAVGFWNFLGAGVFGFLINLPIVSLLRDRHAADLEPRPRRDDGRLRDARRRAGHVRVALPDPRGQVAEKLARISFWSLNIGLAWMVFVTLLPLGVLQLYASVNEGYFEARSLGYLTNPANRLLEWGRMPATWSSSSGVACRSCGSPGRGCGTRGAVRRPTNCPRTCCSSRSSRPRRTPRGRDDRGRVDERTAGLGYSVFLLAVAYGFDVMARRVAVRARQWRTGSFRYHPDHDAWICPQDQWLWPTSYDPEQRIMRYRGKPSVCNACPVKSGCTTSPHGREVTREIDPWPHSEAGRFHRGIACLVALIGVFLPLGMLVSRPSPTDLLVLLATIAVAALASVPLARHLWRTPRLPGTHPAAGRGRAARRETGSPRAGAPRGTGRIQGVVMAASIVGRVVLGLIVLLGGASVRVIQEYERGVVFRLGRLRPAAGRACAGSVPGFERLVRVDLRVVTLTIPPQEVISRDNVPARVNAVVLFRVIDPVRSVMEVENFAVATSQIAQTTLRSVLGREDLDTVLAHRAGPQRRPAGEDRRADGRPGASRSGSSRSRTSRSPRPCSGRWPGRPRRNVSVEPRSSTRVGSCRRPRSCGRPRTPQPEPRLSLQLRYLQTLLELVPVTWMNLATEGTPLLFSRKSM